MTVTSKETVGGARAKGTAGKKPAGRGGKNAKIASLRVQAARIHNVKELAVTLAGGPSLWKIIPERSREGYLVSARVVSLWVSTGKRGA